MITTDSSAMKTESKVVLTMLEMGTYCRLGRGVNTVRYFNLRSEQSLGKRLGVVNGRRAF